MILSLKAASNISSSVPREESPSPLKGLQNLRKLTIFNSTNQTNHSIPQSITTILQYDSILQLFDIIDEMYKQAPKPVENTTPLKRKRSKPLYSLFFLFHLVEIYQMILFTCLLWIHIISCLTRN